MAIKHDKNKPRLGLIPTEAMLAAGRALTYGADGGKYGDYNYKTDTPNNPPLDWNRYYDALLRHLFAWIGGEENDKESKLSHLDHVMACSSMLADAVNSNIGKDTRFKEEQYCFQCLCLHKEGNHNMREKTPTQLVQEDQSIKFFQDNIKYDCASDFNCKKEEKVFCDHTWTDENIKGTVWCIHCGEED